MCVLNLEKLQWAKVKLHGITPQARSAHCTGIIGQKLIIFGGVTSGQHASSTTYLIDFDQIEVKKILAEEKQEREKSLLRYEIRRRRYGEVAA